MIIRLIAVGQKMPSWVETGFQEYAKRLPKENKLELIEIPAAKRGKQADLKRIMIKETAMILSAIPSGDRVVALDVKGKSWDTHQLASHMTYWQSDGRHVSLIVGGPEGLSDEILAKADLKWSLSALTLPHPLVRVIIAESIYRAWTLTVNHPYHRE